MKKKSAWTGNLDATIPEEIRNYNRNDLYAFFGKSIGTLRMRFPGINDSKIDYGNNS